jgi:hypothetical protein
MTTIDRERQISEERRLALEVEWSRVQSYRDHINQLENKLETAEHQLEIANHRIELMRGVIEVSELGKIADELDEDNFATAAKAMRKAAMKIANLECQLEDAYQEQEHNLTNKDAFIAEIIASEEQRRSLIEQENKQLRQLIEMAPKCSVCNGTGTWWPHCSRCDDSGDDHDDCPKREPCDRCRVWREGLAILNIVKKVK